MLLVLLYLPTLIYVSLCSIKFYGWNSWISSVLDDPVYFIFPIFTNISFYKIRSPATQIVKREIEKEPEINSSNSIEDKEEVFGDLQVYFINESLEINLHNFSFQLEDIEYFSDEVFEEESEISEKSIKREHAMKECEEDKKEMEKKEEPEFSLQQSNILYLLFISGAAICLALDIMVQVNRRGELVDHQSLEHIKNVFNKFNSVMLKII